jgi:hypothetical protein
MDFADYRAVKAINASSIKRGRESMLQMHEEMTGPETEQTPSMRLGSLTHLMVLEPDLALAKISTFDGTRRGKAWDEHCEQYADELTIKPDEMDMLERMRDCVWANKEAAWLIRHSKHEVTRLWDGNYGTAKARLDMQGDLWFADLKTTAYIEPSAFGRQFFALGYDLQYGWYSIPAETDTCITIALRNKPAFDCVVYDTPRDVVEKGRDEAIEIATRYACCCAAGSWSGVSATGRELLEVPAWMLGGNNADEIDMEGVEE